MVLEQIGQKDPEVSESQQCTGLPMAKLAVATHPHKLLTSWTLQPSHYRLRGRQDLDADKVKGPSGVLRCSHNRHETTWTVAIANTYPSSPVTFSPKSTN